ncbi:MAG: phosphate regulon transcriptional regulator PhoB [Coxiellaceae bacterium]|nr:phosphate regulon transcriptional regulator PhoB [Coxiellaceae bacterium]
MNKRTILLVEDEAAIRNMVIYSLRRSEFNVEAVEDVPQAKYYLTQQKPDLILLDWMLPTMSGLDYISDLRANPSTKHIPLIMLTAKAEEDNKIKGLTQGADDYITKPFSPRELIARIHTVLRRGLVIDTNGVIQVEDLTVDTQKHNAAIKQHAIKLSRNEYRLLVFFMQHQQRVYTREQLLNAVWGNDAHIDDRAVDVTIRRLRKVLATHGYDRLIKTVHGVGYKFSDVDD